MLLVYFHIVGVDEDVIKIDDNTDIEHIGKDVVHNLWNAAGELVSPKGITCHSNDP